MPASIRALAAHAASGAELRRTARRALIYPAAVLGATGALILFLLGGVVPQFAAIFRSLHLPLPAITLALIAISDFVRTQWPALLGALAAGGGLGTLIARSPRLRRLRDPGRMPPPLL